MKLVVISGLSGAGKSVALATLEDLGFYCVDNLPLSLLSALAAELKASDSPLHEQVAVVIDARNPGAALEFFPDTLEEISGIGVTVDVIFLESDADILLKRFSETRRRHPLTRPGVSLAEAIAAEHALLAPVRLRADLFIDTTHTQYHQLRDLIRNRIDTGDNPAFNLQFQSFGFKHGAPKDADLMFDVRCLPNPHWQPQLRAQTGLDAGVMDFLEASPVVAEMLESIGGFLDRWLGRFEAENRAYFTVAVGCTGGRHRSVYLTEQLARRFKARYPDVIVRHRELGD